ncbi:MAG: hypothetical protein EP348_13140 [Alphaproteobacteria bacterium]|nr:MAG: hypothetical protein EP348_13140 [Alphaproteobacteria bacterium]
MPLDTHIALINTIHETPLHYQGLQTGDIEWPAPPPAILQPFKYYRCRCSGPASGYQIALKYDGLICRIDVTAWGISYKKSTPTYQNMEIIQITNSSPYRIEIVMI